MIKVKLGELVQSQQALNNLINQTISGLSAYKIGKALSVIKTELSLYEKSKQELLKKYCEKNQDNTIKFFENEKVKILPEYINQYNNEIINLNNTQIELNILPLLEDDLMQLNLTPNEIISLMWWIK